MPSISDEIYRRLRDEIVGGSFPRGEPLREQNLALRYGSSRTPVRSALRRLEEEGIVLLLQNRGARIISWSESEVADTYDMVAQIESRIAGIAATRASQSDVEELREVASRLSELLRGEDRNFDRIAHLDYLFHERVAEIANSSTLSEYRTSIAGRFPLRAALQGLGDERLERIQNQHTEFIEALEAHDSEWAASIMRAHILGIKRLLIRYVVRQRPNK